MIGYADNMLAEPGFWDPVVEGLSTLTPGQYMSGECIDFFLRTKWMEQRTRTHMWYLSLEAVRILSTEEGPDAEELQFLRRQLCIPAENAETQPVVFVKWFAQHYFVVVMDYNSG